MKNLPKKKIVKKTVSLTKSLGDLMKDEGGFVSRETILKVGLSTIAALGVAGAVSDMSSAQSHTNSIAPAGGDCVNHTNVTTHSSY